MNIYPSTARKYSFDVTKIPEALSIPLKWDLSIV